MTTSTVIITVTLAPRYAPDGTILSAARRVLYDNLSVVIGTMSAEDYHRAVAMIGECADDHPVGTGRRHTHSETRGRVDA